MCLIFVALRAHPRFPLVVAANRDEFHSRSTAPLGPWPDAPEPAREIVAGRDLVGGGTWMGVTRRGRFAALTNYRGTAVAESDPPSRGGLVSGFLEAAEGARSYLERLRPAGGRYNGFSLLAYDGAACWCYSNRADALTRLEPGSIHGLSNHLLNSPWPKVVRGKAALAAMLARTEAIDGPEVLVERLFDLLTDCVRPSDGELPDTGVGLERERALAPMFVHGSLYGTRSSTVILADAEGTMTVHERSFDAAGSESGRVRLAWERPNTRNCERWRSLDIAR